MRYLHHLNPFYTLDMFHAVKKQLNIRVELSKFNNSYETSCQNYSFSTRSQNQRTIINQISWVYHCSLPGCQNNQCYRYSMINLLFSTRFHEQFTIFNQISWAIFHFQPDFMSHLQLDFMSSLPFSTRFHECLPFSTRFHERFTIFY